MRRIHIVGRRNHGKTTLIQELIEEWMRRGLRIGAIKHSSHQHVLDTPGKDSFRHRSAGANPSALVTPDLISVFARRKAEADVYEQLGALFQGCDFVVVEGHIDCPGLKVEVWRAEVGGRPLAVDRSDVAAVVTDQPLEESIPVYPRSDIAAASDGLLALAKASWGV